MQANMADRQTGRKTWRQTGRLTAVAARQPGSEAVMHSVSEAPPA